MDNINKTVQKRRIIIINKYFQIWFAGLFFVITMMAMIIVAVDIYYTINAQLVNVYHVHPEFRTSLSIVSNLLIVKFIVYIVILGAVSFFISHKIAGPVYRFEQMCRRIEQGDLTAKVRLRKGDSFMNLQNAFNAMIEGLNKKISKIDLAAKMPDSSPDEVQKEINAHFKFK